MTCNILINTRHNLKIKADRHVHHLSSSKQQLTWWHWKHQGVSFHMMFFMRQYVDNCLFFFSFSSYLSPPLETHVGYLKFQNCPFIYGCFNFGFYFLFLFLALCWILFYFFNFILESIIVICYFFLNLVLIVLIFLLFFGSFMNLIFLFNFPLLFKILGCPINYFLFQI
jgi:hypothetical protein